MGVHKYSHSFTRVQLELIIDDYLGLGPYYSVLVGRLREYVRRVEGAEEGAHASEKAHPIRVYTRDYLSKNFQECEAEAQVGLESPKCDIRTTYSSVVPKYYHIYPLEVVVDVLQSQDYYQHLPKNIIINHLLTTENLQIIIETLTIVSEEMSKKIKVTLSSKEVKHAQLLSRPDQKRSLGIDSDFQLPTIQEEPDATLPHSRVDAALPPDAQLGIQLQSKVDIPQDNLFQEEEAPRRVEKRRTFNPLVRTEMASNMELRMGEGERRCSFCQNYLLYLAEAHGEGFGDDCLNKLSREAIRCLRLIAQTVTHFTLFLMESNLTQVPNSIHTLNRVLNTIGIVITEDIFNSELNPKKRKTPDLTYPKPRNLIEHLVPYFSSLQVRQKQASQEFYAIDELLRMVIYCPTVEEVRLQLQNFQVEQFERQDVLKSGEKEERVRALLRKEFSYIREYENERLLISKNTINTRPIYRQLQFEDDPLPPQNTQPTNYNVHSSALPSSRAKPNNSSRHPFLEKNQTSPLPPYTHYNKKENKSLLIELTQSISNDFKADQSEEPELKKSKGDKDKNRNKFKKVAIEKKENEGAETMSGNLKKNLIKNNQTPTTAKPTPHQQDQISSSLLKPPLLEKESDPELSESDFRKLIYSTLAKNQGFTKGEVVAAPVAAGNHTAPAINNYLNSSLSRSTLKKNNGYSSSLTVFMGRKQEEEHMECMEKLEKETYNRQLLNGEFLRNEIYAEINQAAVRVYDNYANACALVDTLRLDQLATEDGLLPQTSESASSRRRLVRSGSRGKNGSNVIEENSTKFNQTGIIRNEKYNKSIKSELINHRQSYLRSVETENTSKLHLAQTSKLRKATRNDTATIRDLYNQELQRHLHQQQRAAQLASLDDFQEAA